ncbi:MAG: hypothetical protein GX601_19730 [Anaerolineales bacterium]|nr:hypothetical protein [Anaerolineales bacterium]
MSSDFDPRSLERPVWPRVLAVALTAVTGLVGIPCWLLGREALKDVIRATGTNQWMVGFLDRAGFILFGLLWLILVYLSAHYYDQAVAKGKLWPTFLRVMGAEVAFIVLSLGVRYVAIWATLGVPPSFWPL